MVGGGLGSPRAEGGRDRSIRIRIATITNAIPKARIRRAFFSSIENVTEQTARTATRA